MFLKIWVFFPFLRRWPYFEAGMLFGGFSSTRVMKCYLGLGLVETLMLKNWLIYGRYGHIHRYSKHAKTRQYSCM